MSFIWILVRYCEIPLALGIFLLILLQVLFSGFSKLPAIMKVTKWQTMWYRHVKFLCLLGKTTMYSRIGDACCREKKTGNVHYWFFFNLLHILTACIHTCGKHHHHLFFFIETRNIRSVTNAEGIYKNNTLQCKLISNYKLIKFAVQSKSMIAALH